MVGDKPEGEAAPPIIAQPRLTPYELVFTERFEGEVFPEIDADAQQTGSDPSDPDAFQLLAAVGAAVREVVPEDAPADALKQYRALLYHAFNLWRMGKRLYVVEPSVARYLIEPAPEQDAWDLALPHPSAYLQLPANLFWGSIAPDATPEPVDGFFVTSSEGIDPLGKPFLRLALLVVMGIRRNRAGFSVIPVDTEAGPGIPPPWLAPGREDGSDFQSILPGGELSGLYSILTSGEVLKLVSRLLWYVDRFSEAVYLEEPVQTRPPDSPAPPPQQPYYLVTLRADAEGS